MLTPEDLTSLEVSTWLDDLFSSEYSYFETGAQLEELNGATLVWMPGLESLAAGCVLQRLQEDSIGAEAEQWLKTVQQRLQTLGVYRARIYQRYADPHLEQALNQHGYQANQEVALLASAYNHALESATSVQLRAVTTEADWLKKLALQKKLSQGPDGHTSPAQLWLKMERIKADLGYMKPYLAIKEGQVCGAVCAAPSDNILRLKNLVVAPEYRRQGVGREIALYLRTLAYQQQFEAVACFAIQSAPSLMMYQQAGYMAVSQQTEWVKALR